MSSLVASLWTSFLGLWDSLSLQAVLSVGSAGITAYFWLVKMNRERAGLRLYRVADFRPDRLQCSQVAGTEKATWYGELCLANPSSLPAVIVQARVQLCWQGKWLDGKMVLEKKDDVPWTLEPLRVLSRSFGCAFLVAEGTTREQIQQAQRLRFTFTTVDGRHRIKEITTANPAPALAA
jgi:hypothetical protein